MSECVDREARRSATAAGLFALATFGLVSALIGASISSWVNASELRSRTHALEEFRDANTVAIDEQEELK